jgi:hypothetical protein
MADRLRGWFHEHSVLICFLIGQAIVGVIYVVDLETRVSVLEEQTSTDKERIDRIVTVMTKELKP